MGVLPISAGYRGVDVAVNFIGPEGTELLSANRYKVAALKPWRLGSDLCQLKKKVSSLSSTPSDPLTLSSRSAPLRSRSAQTGSAPLTLSSRSAQSAQLTLSSAHAQLNLLSSAQLSSIRSAQLALSSIRSAQLTLSSTRSAQLSF